MTEITINFTYVFALMYAIFKAIASIWICKREFQYPIWNGEGVQVQRGLHHKAQSFLRNWAINPEWGVLKAVAFAPVFLFTGKRHVHAFMPWRVQKAPPFCRQCNDKGDYYVDSFIQGQHDWQPCECQNKTVPELKPDHVCHVCLDQKTIGKLRPCPHCERRLILVRYAQTELNRSQIKNPQSCAGCDCEQELADLTLVGDEKSSSWWLCKRCLNLNGDFEPPKDRIVDIDLPDCVKRHLCKDCGYSFVRLSDATYNRCSVCRAKFARSEILQEVVAKGQERFGLLPDPYRYLKGAPCFCGNPNKEIESVGWRHINLLHASRLRHTQPTELQVGDTIVIRSVNEGHRDAEKMGKSLRVMGLNLPFAIVEHDDRDVGRRDQTIDLRGMKIYRRRKNEKSGEPQKYQPLLDPDKLKKGDKFVVLNIQEGGMDSSCRGQVFRITKSGLRIPIIVADNISFGRRLGSVMFSTHDLLVVHANDQYVHAGFSS